MPFLENNSMLFYECRPFRWLFIHQEISMESPVIFDSVRILQYFLRKFSLIKEDILLQHTCKSRIFREVLRDQRLAEPRFRDMSGTVAFRGVLSQQDLFDPGVYRESADMMQAEEADAVGDLDADSIAGEKSFHGVRIVHPLQAVKIQFSGADVLAGPLDVLGAVAEL